MTEAAPQMRQLVDWRAALWAGLIGGLVFLLLMLFLVPSLAGGNAWVIIRLLASVVLGASILAPPATFSLPALAAGLLVHFALSIAFALLLAYLIHHWGLLIGIIGGAVFGLAIYALNFYTLTIFFPWFYAMRSLPVIIAHVIFGAVTGGVYEALEVEEFVPIEAVPK